MPGDVSTARGRSSRFASSNIKLGIRILDIGKAQHSQQREVLNIERGAVPTRQAAILEPRLQLTHKSRVSPHLPGSAGQFYF